MRCWRRLLCAVSPLIVSLALGRAAHADQEATLASLELSWDVPADAAAKCPSRESLLESLSLALGDSRAVEKVHARARIRRDSSNTFVLSLRIRAGKLDNERTVRDPSCDVVAAAAVVMLVLAIDPARALQSDPVAPSANRRPNEGDVAPSDPTPRKPTPAEEPPRTTPQFARTLAPRPRPRRPPRFALGAGVGQVAEFGTFGRPTVGGLASVYAAFVDKFRVDVGFAAWMPVQLTLERDPVYGVRISAMGAVARGCFLPVSRGAMQLGACAGLDLMTARASGFGTRERRSDDALWIAVGLGLIGRHKLNRTTHFVGSLTAILPSEGPHYGVQIGDVARPIHGVSFGVRVTLGVELALF